MSSSTMLPVTGTARPCNSTQGMDGQLTCDLLSSVTWVYCSPRRDKNSSQLLWDHCRLGENSFAQSLLSSSHRPLPKPAPPSHCFHPQLCFFSSPPFLYPLVYTLHSWVWSKTGLYCCVIVAEWLHLSGSYECAYWMRGWD